MELPPCVLCWYQRIFMFPLVLILPVGLFPFDAKVVRYALPLAVGGWLVVALPCPRSSPAGFPSDRAVHAGRSLFRSPDRMAGIPRHSAHVLTRLCHHDRAAGRGAPPEPPMSKKSRKKPGESQTPPRKRLPAAKHSSRRQSPPPRAARASRARSAAGASSSARRSCCCSAFVVGTLVYKSEKEQSAKQVAAKSAANLASEHSPDFGSARRQGAHRRIPRSCLRDLRRLLSGGEEADGGEPRAGSGCRSAMFPFTGVRSTS